jgi:hypothetical protein
MVARLKALRTPDHIAPWQTGLPSASQLDGLVSVHYCEGGYPMDDRRVFERVPAHFPLRFLNLYSGKEIKAEACDISAKGVGLIASEAVEPHTPLELWLKISETSEPLYVRGEVVWSSQVEEDKDKFKSGVQLERAHLMAFSRFVRTA